MFDVKIDEIQSTALREGTRLIDRYVVGAPLGEGGFATVYDGFDELIEREVAIKVLSILDRARDEEAMVQMLERFRREAKTAAKIRHPNVVTIFDMGLTEQSLRQPFIVMERLHGHDMDEELAMHGAMAPERALPLIMTCLEALAEGHKQGIVHKDLKPANLFLHMAGTPKEEVRVLDFGIARLGDQSAGLTSTGQLMGTARYFAPEYIRSQLVSPALDVYQMGLILAEILTGAPVVQEQHQLSCIMRHTEGDLTIHPELLASPVGAVIARALRLDPNERYSDAGAFAKALADIDPGHISTLDSGLIPTLNRPNSGPFDNNTAPHQTPITGELQQARHTSGPSPTVAPHRNDVETTIPTHTEPPSNRTTIALVGAIAAIALGVAAAAFFSLDSKQPTPPTATSTLQSTSPPQPSQKPLAKKPTQTTATHPPKTVARTPDSPTASPSPPTASKPASVQLVTIPPGASVKSKGKTLGKTPLTIRFKAGANTPRDIKIARRGFKPAALSLTPKDGPKRVLHLKPIPRAAKPAKANKPSTGVGLLAQ